MLKTDRTAELTAAAKALDEPTFVQRYNCPFVVFPRPDDLSTTEVELPPAAKVSLESATGLQRSTPPIDENMLLEIGFILEPIKARWPGDLGAVVTVGRARGNDIYIPDQTVSKVHAYFRVDEEGVLWLFDPGSRNGTYVGGTRLRIGAQHKLGESEAVTFGGVRTLVKNAVGLHKFLKRAQPPGNKSGPLPKVKL